MKLKKLMQCNLTQQEKVGYIEPNSQILTLKFICYINKD